MTKLGRSVVYKIITTRKIPLQLSFLQFYKSPSIWNFLPLELYPEIIRLGTVKHKLGTVKHRLGTVKHRMGIVKHRWGTVL